MAYNYWIDNQNCIETANGRSSHESSAQGARMVVYRTQSGTRQETFEQFSLKGTKRQVTIRRRSHLHMGRRCDYAMSSMVAELKATEII